MLICIKQIMASKPPSAVVSLLQRIVCDQIEEKSLNRLMAATLKDFRSENIECNKYQLVFVTTAVVLLKPCLSRLKQLSHRFAHWLYVCLFLSEDIASGFQFNSF